MSNKKMETAVIDFDFILPSSMVYEDCEFPEKVSSKRSRMQRKKAAKKNKFPVGLRKEISSVRRSVKEVEVTTYNRTLKKAEAKVTDVILQDVSEEKANMAKFGDPFENPNHEGPFEDKLFYEYWKWRDEQQAKKAEEQFLREEFGY